MDTKYKDMIINGSVFSGAPINDEVKISFNNEILKEYLPALDRVVPKEQIGLKSLMIIMTNHEGFYDKSKTRKKPSRSYASNNPGNVGNVDSGGNVNYKTLEEGILAQMNYILKVSWGKHKAYPVGNDVFLKPYFSKEIADNPKTYAGKSPYLPGYKFRYIGQLDQFVKIYSTGARNGNSYLSTIISYFKNLGIHITPETTLREITEITKPAKK